MISQVKWEQRLQHLAKPELYLCGFGSDPQDINFAKAEEYLVQGIKSRTILKTMDDLRYKMYHQSNKSASDLPQTSHATKSHTMHAFDGT